MVILCCRVTFTTKDRSYSQFLKKKFRIINWIGNCVLQEVIWRDLANEVQETQFSPVEVKVTIWQDAKSEKTYLNRSLR